MTGFPDVILISRHAEKPDEDQGIFGVDEAGKSDPHSLSVVGWQRAGALAALMAHAPTSAHPDLVKPERVVATKPTHRAKSRRELATATPVASRLGLVVCEDFGHGQVSEVAGAILAAESAVLVVWHHGEIPELALALGVDRSEIPVDWPDDRYDLLWVLTREPLSSSESRPRYHLEVVPQRLLAGDTAVAPTMVQASPE